MKTAHRFSLRRDCFLCGIALLFFFNACSVWANNLQISNVAMTDAGGGQAEIQFTLSWDNSWYESWTENGGTVSVTNWDAVWVFIKYRQSGGLWKHVKLETSGHTPTGGTTITVPDEGDGRGLGAFVHRSGAGTGSVTCTNMKLRWDIAAEGLPSNNEIDLTVLGIEMVYIPEGAFYLGSGGSENYHFHEGPNTTTPYLVSSEDAITLGTGAGELYATGAVETSGTIDATYPKGFAALYCMKYEITAGQYVAFLNLLDPSVATNFFVNTVSARNTVTKAAGDGYETSAPDRATAFLSGSTFLTYLDWCGLRPMSELEFEKICRGPKDPWINEYVWGNTSYTQQTGFVGVDGSGTETADPADANITFGNAIGGPVRAGIFATGSTGREGAGAGYYGVLDLGGNLYEPVVVISSSWGRSFTGAHGDGNEYTPFDKAGQWIPTNYSSTYGFRGTSYASSMERARTSDRTNAQANPFRSSPGGDHGGRGVRTAP